MKKGKRKIKIERISAEVFSFKGFDERGCFGHACDDACCRYGCDVDRESYDLMRAHRKLIEDYLGVALEECFEGGWRGDAEFLGEDYIESSVGETGYCVFHERSGKGCVLYNLVEREGLPRRLIPSICRLYPLSWAYGELFVTDDLERTCNCLAEDNRSRGTIFESQRREIKDILDLDPHLVQDACAGGEMIR